MVPCHNGKQSSDETNVSKLSQEKQENDKYLYRVCNYCEKMKKPKQ